jgi:hypothetical protein
VADGVRVPLADCMAELRTLAGDEARAEGGGVLAMPLAISNGLRELLTLSAQTRVVLQHCGAASARLRDPSAASRLAKQHKKLTAGKKKDRNEKKREERLVNLTIIVFFLLLNPTAGPLSKRFA